MQMRKIAREWRDVYANEIARAVHDGHEPDTHALRSWARYDAESRSDRPFSTPPTPTHREGMPDDPRP